jgi:hypothetical protein
MAIMASFACMLFPVLAVFWSGAAKLTITGVFLSQFNAFLPRFFNAHI